MGKRIVKKWDLPPELCSALMVLAAAFLIGGIGGLMLAALADGEGADELCAYLSDYIRLAAPEDLRPELWPVLWGQLWPVLLLVVFGTTALGTAGIPILLGARGFLLAFSAGCFCRVFGVRGILLSLVLFLVPAVLWAPASFIAGTQGFIHARELLHRAGGGDGRWPSPLGPVFRCETLVCVALAVAAGVVEHWVIPAVFPVMVDVVL